MGYGDGRGGIVSLTGEPLTPAAMERAQAVEQALSVEMSTALSDVQGWRNEDAALTRIVAGTASKHATMSPEAAQQHAAALALLMGEVLGADSTREARAAIARHVSILVEAGSPEAMIVERGLAALDGTWDRERIGEAARTTAAATRTALAVRETNARACPRCDAAFKAAAPEIYASSAAYRQAQRDAADRLDALGAR